MAEKIGKKKFEEKIRNSSLPVVIDFYSDSCVACKKLSPAFSEAESVLKGKFLFYKVNTNFEDELTEIYEIMAIPTLVVFQSGKEAGRKTGAQSPEKLLDWLKTFLNE